MPEWTVLAPDAEALAIKIGSINCNDCTFVILQVVHKLIHGFGNHGGLCSLRSLIYFI